VAAAVDTCGDHLHSAPTLVLVAAVHQDVVKLLPDLFSARIAPQNAVIDRPGLFAQSVPIDSHFQPVVVYVNTGGQDQHSSRDLR